MNEQTAVLEHVVAVTSYSLGTRVCEWFLSNRCIKYRGFQAVSTIPVLSHSDVLSKRAESPLKRRAVCAADPHLKCLHLHFACLMFLCSNG